MSLRPCGKPRVIGTPGPAALRLEGSATPPGQLNPTPTPTPPLLANRPACALAALFAKGEITREVAEAAVDKTQEGSFCVRARAGVPDEYVLCVVYKNKFTHHLIKKADDGNLAVNSNQYGQHTSIEQLVGKLGQPGVPGWPVRLLVPEVSSSSDSR